MTLDEISWVPRNPGNDAFLSSRYLIRRPDGTFWHLEKPHSEKALKEYGPEPRATEIVNSVCSGKKVIGTFEVALLLTNAELTDITSPYVFAL